MDILPVIPGVPVVYVEIHREYVKVIPTVNGEWQKFVASVFLHAVVMAWV